MDNFYVASGQAPAVYLEYARWLATNGIARGNMLAALVILLFVLFRKLRHK